MFIIGIYRSRYYHKKDIGVKISADMKMSEQCSIAVSKGKHGFIRRNIIYKEKEQMIPL